jgi:molybdopterin molybdotransferase
MINVAEAQKLLISQKTEMSTEEISIDLACGRILGENIVSPIAHPQFNQSAVDGYAIQFSNIEHDRPTSLEVVDEIPAGKSPQKVLSSGETIRIFTGGKVPEGADSVLKQEDVTREENRILMFDPNIKKGANVRKKGEQIEKGDVALREGIVINSAAIGFLAMLGISKVRVKSMPNVAVLASGSELIPLTEKLEDGKIFESNGHMLHAAFIQIGIQAEKHLVHDDPNDLEKRLKDLTDRNDIVVSTGGVSVGDYDFIPKVMKEIGFEEVFHKVAQKPGKPLLFMKKENKYFFGLPGNPRAALVGFFEYIKPFIKKIMGDQNPFPKKIYLPLMKAHKKRGNRRHFVIGKIVENGVEIMEGQLSHMLQSFAYGDVLVALEEDKNEFAKGENVEVHLIL